MAILSLLREPYHVLITENTLLKTNKFIKIKTEGGDFFTGEHDIYIYHNEYINIINNHWTGLWDIYSIQQYTTTKVGKNVKYFNELKIIFKKLTGTEL
jgi:hypothetical protein